jgi:hypothetical protein
LELAHDLPCTFLNRAQTDYLNRRFHNCGCGRGCVCEKNTATRNAKGFAYPRSPSQNRQTLEVSMSGGPQNRQKLGVSWSIGLHNGKKLGVSWSGGPQNRRTLRVAWSGGPQHRKKLRVSWSGGPQNRQKLGVSGMPGACTSAFVKSLRCGLSHNICCFPLGKSNMGSRNAPNTSHNNDNSHVRV